MLTAAPNVHASFAAETLTSSAVTVAPVSMNATASESRRRNPSDPVIESENPKSALPAAATVKVSSVDSAWTPRPWIASVGWMPSSTG